MLDIHGENGESESVVAIYVKGKSTRLPHVLASFMILPANFVLETNGGRGQDNYITTSGGLFVLLLANDDFIQEFIIEKV